MDKNGEGCISAESIAKVNNLSSPLKRHGPHFHNIVITSFNMSFGLGIWITTLMALHTLLGQRTTSGSPQHGIVVKVLD